MSTAGKAFLVGCLVVLVLGFGGCMVLVGWLIKDSDQMRMSVEAPIQVERGARLEIVARIENRSDEPQELVSLEVDERYAAGIAVRASSPPFVESRGKRIDGGLQLDYGLELAPGASQTVVLEAAALHLGDYAGEIEFCINDRMHCVSQVVRTVVVLPGGENIPAERPAAGSGGTL